jgi:hypothetical protein
LKKFQAIPSGAAALEQPVLPIPSCLSQVRKPLLAQKRRRREPCPKGEFSISMSQMKRQDPLAVAFVVVLTQTRSNLLS